MQLRGVKTASFAAVFAFFERHLKGRSIALSVSGGPDSTALMALFAHWQNEVGAPNRAHVFTIDHHLRPEADKEAEAVAAFAANLGLAHETLHWIHDGITSGLQEKGRAARYQLLHEACERHGLDCVLTGHTQDDQAETILMRLTHGSGLSGLGGMKAVSALPEGEGIALLRPLLDVRKAELLALLDENAISYVKDPTNEKPAFERVRVRALLKGLEADMPHAISRMTEAGKHLARADAALDAMRDRFIADHMEETKAGLLRFSFSAFQTLPEEIALRVLARVTELYQESRGARMEELLRLYEALVVARETMTLGGWQFGVRGEMIEVVREIVRHTPPLMALEKGVKAIWDGRFMCMAGEDGYNIAPLMGRWDEAKKLCENLREAKLSPLLRASLPVIERDGAIVAVPYFGAFAHVNVAPCLKTRLCFGKEGL